MNAELQYPLTVQYCGACTMPPEYCEYSDNMACREWLAELKRGYTYKAPLTVQLQTSSRKMKVDPAAAKHKRAHKIPEGKNAKNAHNDKRDVIKIDEKIKDATHIMGLASFGVDLKEACKFFTKKFATRCIIVPGTYELFIQGNFVCQLFDLIPEKWSNIRIRDIEDKGVRQVASSDEE